LAKFIRIGGAAVLAVLLLFAALGPATWQVRTGLGWQLDHVIGYFGFAVLFSLAWRRPLMVGGILMGSAMVLEALQALTPDRHCDLEAALYGVAGALAGAVFAELCDRVLRPVLVLQRLWRAPPRKLMFPRAAYPKSLQCLVPEGELASCGGWHSRFLS
jgi:VanZ family protein